MVFNLGPMMATDGAWLDKPGRLGYKGMFVGDGFFGFHAVMCLVTWVLVIALLVVLIRYFWKLGDKIK